MHFSTLRLSLKVLLRRKFFTFVSLFGIAFTLVVLTVVTAMLDSLVEAAPPEVDLDRTLLLNRVDFDAEQRNYSGGPGYGYIDRFFRDLPGVESMTVFTGEVEVVSFHRGQKIDSRLRRTDGAYWEVLRFTFLEGRPYSADDVEAGRAVAVISASTRNTFFGDRPAVGERLLLGERAFEVVGVVEDVGFSRRSATGDAWAPISTAPNEAWRIQNRGNFEAALVLERGADFDVTRREADTRLAAATPEILGDGFERTSARLVTRAEEIALEFLGNPTATTHAQARFFSLLALAALLFMLLPALNLVSVNMSRIFERAGEIGVRKAFGASARDLVAQFVFENVMLCAIGGGIGFVGAWFALRMLARASLFPQADFALDPTVFAIGLALAVLFGVLSGLYPAWRMSRLHPVQALKGGLR